MPLVPASGTGQFFARSRKIIRFARHGCTNRPFFHIVVTEVRRDVNMPVIEQVGTYDPMPNEFNQQIVGMNTERIRYWIGKGASVSTPVAQLLGLSGLLPIHPRSVMQAERNRKAQAAKEAEAAKGETEKSEATN